MLLTIASAFFYTEIKSGTFMKMLSGIMKVIWVKWEIQGMVLLSLFLQFLLVGLGYRLKYHGKAGALVSILVWLTYLGADWIATVGLSTLLKAKKDELNNQLVAFWTPFLLLHLGGPDTISAISSSDNELWLRYFLGLFIQVGVAVYVYVRFQPNSALTYVALPLFMAGIIKYGERVWILRAASRKQFSNCIFAAPSPTLKSQDPFANGSPIGGSGTNKITLDEHLQGLQIIQEAKDIHKAFCLYNIFIPLFSDIRLRIQKDLMELIALSKEIQAEDAFKLLELELGFLYDMLYTKAAILQTKAGVFFRGICLLSAFSALMAFSLIHEKRSYQNVDIVITYMLLGGAIFLDVYSIILHVFSNWAVRELTSPGNKVRKLVGSGIVSKLIHGRAKKGIAFMAQHSLIDYLLEARTSWWTKIVRVIDTEDNLAKSWWITWEPVTLDLKKFIYSSLGNMFDKYKEKGFQYEELLPLLKSRGYNVLTNHGLSLELTGSSTKDEAFSHSLLLWHIATFIIFHDDHKRFSSKLLSNYMMYLLLVQPQMLIKGMGEVRIKETCDDMLDFFKDMTSCTKDEATSALLDCSKFDIMIYKFAKPGRTKSVMLEGCRLASNLQVLVQLLWDPEEKWKMIAEVWMEMLVHAASKCEWKEHAKKLGNGGELLTHVAHLMAHLGITEHIQIVEREQ